MRYNFGMENAVQLIMCPIFIMADVNQPQIPHSLCVMMFPSLVSPCGVSD